MHNGNNSLWASHMLPWDPDSLQTRGNHTETSFHVWTATKVLRNVNVPWWAANFPTGLTNFASSSQSMSMYYELPHNPITKETYTSTGSLPNFGWKLFYMLELSFCSNHQLHKGLKMQNNTRTLHNISPSQAGSVWTKNQTAVTPLLQRRESNHRLVLRK